MAAEKVGRAGLMEKLKDLGIETSTIEHPEVFTVEEMMPHVGHLPGAHVKNLFLYGKKKKDYWLFSARHDVEVKLNDLSKKVGAPGGLRFADEKVLYEKLGVKQGCVTGFAVINDTNNDVKFIIDEALITGQFEKIHFHPMENSATTAIAPADFVKFCEAVNHKPTPVKLDD